ncbi:hypothetical protein [Zavarzinella formosa]|uniref:hypothetical protein n=1 Tax=Zavarzinella formosa TaxID=360055 RepID=UPI0002FD4071|nr:hypothetical protein [Zavarzinella formosa]
MTAANDNTRAKAPFDWEAFWSMALLTLIVAFALCLVLSGGIVLGRQMGYQDNQEDCLAFTHSVVGR